MPLMPGKSKKAFSRNVETEMNSGKPQDQSLAIAYATKRKTSRKKMASGGETELAGTGSPSDPISRKNNGWGAIIVKAEGGPVSAKDEKRPMPSQTDNDARTVSKQNNSMKPMLSATNEPRPMPKRGLKTTPIKHPKMVASDVLQARLRGEEDDLQLSAAPASPDEPPRSDLNEEHQAQTSGNPDDEDPRNEDQRSAYAEGGNISVVDESRPMPEDEYNDSEEISDNEEAHAQDLNHTEHPELMDMNAQPEEEADEEHHASVASAIMAKRKKMAEGGEADLSRNADEDPNMEDQMSFEALKKENYDETSSLNDLDYDTDESIGQDRDDERDTDTIAAIRRRMKNRSPITE